MNKENIFYFIVKGFCRLLVDIGVNGEQYRAGQEAECLLLKNKMDREVKFAIAVVDSVLRYKDEFLD